MYTVPVFIKFMTDYMGILFILRNTTRLVPFKIHLAAIVMGFQELAVSVISVKAGFSVILFFFDYMTGSVILVGSPTIRRTFHTSDSAQSITVITSFQAVKAIFGNHLSQSVQLELVQLVFLVADMDQLKFRIIAEIQHTVSLLTTGKGSQGAIGKLHFTEFVCRMYQVSRYIIFEMVDITVRLL